METPQFSIYDKKVGYLPIGIRNHFSLGLGNMAGKYGSDAPTNRARFYERTKTYPNSIVLMLPEHGNRIRYVSFEDVGQDVTCDVMITKDPRITIEVRTADCLVISMYARTRVWKRPFALAVAHIGKDGTGLKLAQKVVNELKYVYDINPSRLFVGIGPGIKPCHYDMDLIRENTDQMVRAGVTRSHIVTANLCTYCAKDDSGQPLFHSHRRADDSKLKESEGRMSALIALRRPGWLL